MERWHHGPAPRCRVWRGAVAGRVALVGVLLALCACGTPPRGGTAGHDAGLAPTTREGLRSLDAIIGRGVADRLYPGAVCVVGRVEPGTGRHEVVYARAFGSTAYEPAGVGAGGGRPVSLQTRYDLASVTKLVGTTSAALIAISDGRLALDAPVAAYLPDFARHGNAGVTVRQLMTHTSGLPAYERPGVVERRRREGEPASDALIAHYAALRPLAPPGARYTYSCLNFQTLARVVETACGRSMEALLQARLFGPMGMRDTTWRPVAGPCDGIAPTFRDASGLPVAGVVHDPLARYHGSAPHCPGNAGLFGTAPDLARWCRLVLQHGRWGERQLIEPGLIQLATSIQTDPAVVGEARGLGFDVYESSRYVSEHNARPGHHLVGHSGYTGTLVLIDQHTGVYMVLLTNRTLPPAATATDQAPALGAVRSACWRVVRDWAEGR
ncbi:MAG: serine hydrolase domain-containing protein [Phycisphaeraceae bacterium]